MEAETNTTKMPDRMELLRRLAPCPRCGKVMQMRSLAYKHLCSRPCTPEEMAAAENKRLQALEARAAAMVERRAAARAAALVEGRVLKETLKPSRPT